MGQDVEGRSGAITDEDFENWAAQAESTRGYTGEHVGPPRVGRPGSIGDRVRPFTFRVAAEQGTTASELIRRLIDSLSAPVDEEHVAGDHW